MPTCCQATLIRGLDAARAPESFEARLARLESTLAGSMIGAARQGLLIRISDRIALEVSRLETTTGTTVAESITAR
ncbi:hypothetical protein HZ989_03720 [Brevundimonas sp. AJA228-03]|uniref:hypothetical protein n=1 Tax=Brevundimonas sp. AJA228-03 TaxID=2752515 RepID=UPI001AE066CA|nr:hypothetical protein [Brevundimonas sp. AJA228-03]QTN20195.1 hypothetical protein HZ989_03720 [Brevundimonas sp. AJA228-03]